MQTNIRVLRDNILVRPFESDGVSEGGIIVPDSCKTRNNKAIVVAVGNKAMVHIGEVVFHIKDAGTPIEENGILYYIMRDKDCLAKN